MVEELSLKSVLKNIQKKYGEKVVQVGVEDLAVDGILSLGSPSFDFCVYGGIPEGRIVEFSGPEGSGKTTAAFLTAASYQRKELERNPDNPRAILLIDNEGTADPSWAKTLGYDMSENAKVSTYIYRPEAQTAEQIFDDSINFLKTGEIGLVIFDSIATLVPMQIADESMEKKQMGGIANSLTRFANTIIGLLRKYKATFVGINQVRENLSGYGNPILTPGGRSWKHACSLRLMFKRGEFFDDDGNILKASAESPAGHIIEVAVLKTKICKWDRKLGYMHLNYSRGVDIIQDTIDVAIHLGYIDDSVQGSYNILDENGELIEKIRGKKNVKPFLEKNVDIYAKLYDRIYKKLSLKDDPFIKSFEEMLTESIEEKFNVNLSKEIE